MKKIIFLIILVFAFIITTNAQEPESIPSAPSAPVLRNDDIRRRSLELERVKRDSYKRDSNAPIVNRDIDKKYPQIKEDFEGMQLSQAAIIRAYTKGEIIDYAMIEASSNRITKSAKRLRTNVFSRKIKSKKKKKDKKQSKSLRDLIIELDDAIGNVTSSAMFLNLRVVDPKVATKTQYQVNRIIILSKKLSAVAKKMR